MDKYERWLHVGLERLVDDFLKGDFKPQNESDIKCQLYHTLLQTRSQIKGLSNRHLIFSELSVPASQERVDLVLGWWKKKGSLFEPRLLIEIKETSLGHLKPEEVKEGIKGDIYKLQRYRSLIQNSGDSNVMKYLRKPTAVFFFRGASKHGIAVRTHQQLQKLQENYEDLAFWWGPC